MEAANTTMDERGLRQEETEVLRLSEVFQKAAPTAAFALLLIFAEVACSLPNTTSRTSTVASTETPATMKNSIGLEFVFIPTGRYEMGHKEHRKPVTTQVVRGFWMSKFETTNEQFEYFCKHVRSKESAAKDMPATGIWRSDAESFAHILSAREGRNYRLPTEIEWEYAARGGQKGTDYPWGAAPLDNRMNSGTGAATWVGRYPPNKFGLFDMTGNAAEYVQDDYRDEETDVMGKTPILWMAKGGSFSDWNGFVWYADPVPVNEPRELYNCYGFRLVLDAPPPKSRKSEPLKEGS